jgi:deoxyadenosine/deoxycytidine kinase
MNSNIVIISIEGNIGSGKSTLLHHLKQHCNQILEKTNKTNELNSLIEKNGNTFKVVSVENVCTIARVNVDATNVKYKYHFLEEPVNEWSKIKDKAGETILEKFYNNQEKYSFPFQMMAYISRLKNLMDVVNEINNDSGGDEFKHIIITERSLYSDRYVFEKMLYEGGKIEEVNHLIYLNWFDAFAKAYPVKKVVYVETAPKICHKRIEQRLRKGENSISIEYLNMCNQYHEVMIFKNDDLTNWKENRLILNGNFDIYKEHAILELWIKQIIAFAKM